MLHIKGRMTLEKFINRKQELTELEHELGKFNIIYGRRRIGKSELLNQWMKTQKHALVSQAIECDSTLQLSQIIEDFSELLPSANLKVQNWKDCLAIFSMIKEECTLILDEFPYLVKGDPSLPSRLQRWVDREQPEHIRLICLGSSQTMMHSLFLDSSSPLYERASLIMKLDQLSYAHFCEYKKYDPLEENSFLNFSLVGGIPHYWSMIGKNSDPIVVADRLYFGRPARLESEPDRILKDEGTHGMQAKTILECVGRGCTKPSEIAGRLGIKQSDITRSLKVLRDASLLQRVQPFGENVRTTKRTLYEIQDPALNFWYEIFSPHRSRWHNYSSHKKLGLIRLHASHILESSYRDFVRGERYWEGEVEFDSIRFVDEECKNITISEIKYKQLDEKERRSLQQKVKMDFYNSKIKKRYNLHKIEILDRFDVLNKLA